MHLQIWRDQTLYLVHTKCYSTCRSLAHLREETHQGLDSYQWEWDRLVASCYRCSRRSFSQHSWSGSWEGTGEDGGAYYHMATNTPTSRGVGLGHYKTVSCSESTHTQWESVGYNACTVQMGYSPSTDSQTHLGFLWSSSSFHWSHTPPSPLQEVHTSVRPGTTDTAHVLTRASKCLSRIIVKGTCANQPVECCEASHIIHSDWETPIAKHQSYSPVWYIWGGGGEGGEFNKKGSH